MIKAAFSTKFFAFIKVLAIICLALYPLQLLHAQPPQVKLQFNLKNYIKRYSDEAVRQMVEFKIPASVILAQAIFESGSGTSELALKSNNHFGIKCHQEWLGDTIARNDDTLNECFRKYYTVQESYTDHSMFLSTRERYAPLFLLPITDYAGWCYGIKNAGYATYPTYAEDLIKLIESEKLYELDNCVLLKSRPVACAKGTLPAIRETPLRSTSFSLKDFSKDGVLWLDEKDVLIQSIDMIIDGGDEDMTAVAAD